MGGWHKMNALCALGVRDQTMLDQDPGRGRSDADTSVRCHGACPLQAAGSKALLLISTAHIYHIAPAQRR